jgi:hypothetical protein
MHVGGVGRVSEMVAGGRLCERVYGGGSIGHVWGWSRTWSALEESRSSPAPGMERVKGARIREERGNRGAISGGCFAGGDY